MLLRRSPGVTLDATMNGDGRGSQSWDDLCGRGRTLAKIASDSYRYDDRCGSWLWSGALWRRILPQLVIVSETAEFVSDGSTVSGHLGCGFQGLNRLRFHRQLHPVFGEGRTGRYLAPTLPMQHHTTR